MLKKLQGFFNCRKLRTQIILHFLLITFAAIFISNLFTYSYLKDELITTYYNKLIAIREIKKHQIEDYIQHLKEQLKSISKLPFVLQASKELKTIDRKNNHILYQKYHTIFKDFLHNENFENIFLVDVQSDEILFCLKGFISTRKNIKDTQYISSNLQQAYYSIVKDKETFRFADFEHFYASKGEPASFMATAVFDNDGSFVAVIIAELSIKKINEIMTGHYKWEKEGLGKTGETYIIGDDCTMRNDSRFFIEKNPDYFRQINKAGLSSDTISMIKDYQTTVLFQKMRPESCKMLFETNKGLSITKDYRGVEVLSAYSHLDIKGVNWMILSEIDSKEAFYLLTRIQIQSTLILIILFVILVFSTTKFTKSITEPLHQLLDGMKELGKGDLSQRVHLPRCNNEFNALANQFNQSLERLENLTHSVNHLSILSSTDTLTQIMNRRKFNEKIHLEIKRVKRTKEPLSLAFIDIDHFKKINDTYGHTVGDDILIELTQLISSKVREIDIFARYGGEEFVILLINTNKEEAKISMENLRKTIVNHKFKYINNLTCSFGVAEYKKENNGRRFIDDADKALYTSKKLGRNQVNLF